MHHRHVGKSGLLVSEIAYGNWLTHGAQIEKKAAFACVHAALDAGITTFQEVVAPRDDAGFMAPAPIDNPHPPHIFYMRANRRSRERSNMLSRRSIVRFTVLLFMTQGVSS